MPDPLIVIRAADTEIGWDGEKWLPLTPGPLAGAMCRTAALCAAESEPGDHHLSPMVAAATRAARIVGGAVTKAPEYPPLADGVVS